MLFFWSGLVYSTVIIQHITFSDWIPVIWLTACKLCNQVNWHMVYLSTGLKCQGSHMDSISHFYTLWGFELEAKGQMLRETRHHATKGLFFCSIMWTANTGQTNDVDSIERLSFQGQLCLEHKEMRTLPCLKFPFCLSLCLSPPLSRCSSHTCSGAEIIVKAT